MTTPSVASGAWASFNARAASTWLSDHIDAIEAVMCGALQAAIAAEPADAVRFMAEHIAGECGCRLQAKAAGTSLQQNVGSWLESQPSPATEMTAAELQDKFSEMGAITFNYGDVEQFFAGLEGLVGAPDPQIMVAMEHEHADDKRFVSWNSGRERQSTPREEWVYVVENQAGSREDRKLDATGRDAWKLDDFCAEPRIVRAKLLRAEVVGLRLYTGPMYQPYSSTLRRGIRGAYVTTLHAINSGIIKLAKLTKATTVYRGVSGGVLPKQFWELNEHNVMGGVELGFMSTSTQRDVALEYMRSRGDRGMLLFEIRMGMIDRGADVSMLSQFPAEREILFAPLTGLEVASVPRIENGVIVVELRLSCNLHDLTIEEVVGKMSKSHTSLVSSLCNGLQLAGAPESALQPLQGVLQQAAKRGREYFNVSELFLEATAEALRAKASSLALLADEASWVAEAHAESADELATRMRRAAEACARDEAHDKAAQLLMMATTRAPVPKHVEVVERVSLAHNFELTHGERVAFEALSLLLATSERREPWPLTIRELVRLAGQHAWRLAIEHGQPNDLYEERPFDQEATVRARKGSALLSAAAAGDVEAIRSALATSPADEVVANGVTPLMLAALAKDCSGPVHALLAAKADPSLRSRAGLSALDLAAQQGATAVVGALVTSGADVNAQSGTYGHRPLLMAARGGHADTVEGLLKAGALVNGTNFANGTALTWAAELGNVRAMEVLLAAGADVHIAIVPSGQKIDGFNHEVYEYDGMTALTYAARSGHVAAVQLLINAGANLEKADKTHGKTPLMLAVSMGHLEAAKALLEAGASHEPKDSAGVSALGLARKAGHAGCVALLRTSGAQE